MFNFVKFYALRDQLQGLDAEFLIVRWPISLQMLIIIQIVLREFYGIQKEACPRWTTLLTLKIQIASKVESKKCFTRANIRLAKVF